MRRFILVFALMAVLVIAGLGLVADTQVTEGAAVPPVATVKQESEPAGFYEWNNITCSDQWGGCYIQRCWIGADSIICWSYFQRY